MPVPITRSKQFLVLERDNRGVGVDAVIESTLGRPVGSKRVFLIGERRKQVFGICTITLRYRACMPFRHTHKRAHGRMHGILMHALQCRVFTQTPPMPLMCATCR
jgi:hypothetical protein